MIAWEEEITVDTDYKCSKVGQKLIIGCGEWSPNVESRKVSSSQTTEKPRYVQLQKKNRIKEIVEQLNQTFTQKMTLESHYSSLISSFNARRALRFSTSSRSTNPSPRSHASALRRPLP